MDNLLKESLEGNDLEELNMLEGPDKPIASSALYTLKCFVV